MKYLPSNITHLDLRYLGSLEYEGFRYLSSTLQDLELDGNSLLIDECLNYLPTTLLSLKLIEQEGITKEGVEEWKKRYKVY